LCDVGRVAVKDFFKLLIFYIYIPSMKFMGPQGTELLPFLPGYVT